MGNWPVVLVASMFFFNSGVTDVLFSDVMGPVFTEGRCRLRAVSGTSTICKRGGMASNGDDLSGMQQINFVIPWMNRGLKWTSDCPQLKPLPCSSGPAP